jgi:hypothetical protein
VKKEADRENSSPGNGIPNTQGSETRPPPLTQFPASGHAAQYARSRIVSALLVVQVSAGRRASSKTPKQSVIHVRSIYLPTQ